jgi:hypothetical protein
LFGGPDDFGWEPEEEPAASTDEGDIWSTDGGGLWESVDEVVAEAQVDAQAEPAGASAPAAAPPAASAPEPTAPATPAVPEPAPVEASSEGGLWDNDSPDELAVVHNKAELANLEAFNEDLGGGPSGLELDAPPAAVAAPAEASDALEGLAPDRLEAIVRDVARSILERIAWEVVPDLAEEIIRDEIDRLTK